MGKRVPASPGFGERIELLLWKLVGERASQREVADLLGVKRGRLGAWIVRGNFPGRVELAERLGRLPIVTSRQLDPDALARWAEDGVGELEKLLRRGPHDLPPAPALGSTLTMKDVRRANPPSTLIGLIRDVRAGVYDDDEEAARLAWDIVMGARRATGTDAGGVAIAPPAASLPRQDSNLKRGHHMRHRSSSVLFIRDLRRPTGTDGR